MGLAHVGGGVVGGGAVGARGVVEEAKARRVSPTRLVLVEAGVPRRDRVLAAPRLSAGLHGCAFPRGHAFPAAWAPAGRCETGRLGHALPRPSRPGETGRALFPPAGQLGSLCSRREALRVGEREGMRCQARV